MNEIGNQTSSHGIDFTLIHWAAVTVLAVHLIKWVWEQVFGLPLEITLSPKLRKKQAQAFIKELLGENDSQAKRELARILSLGIFDAKSAPVPPNYKEHCRSVLAQHIVQREVSVGVRETTYLRQSFFLDAISATLNGKVRTDLATSLTSHFQLERQKRTNLKDIVGVIGVKRGSPWLAIEFANKMHMPVALHRGGERVNVGERNPRDRFDGNLPETGRVLIVDDSITGGTMVLEAIADLRALHLEVDSCMVLFEVFGKNGQQTLASTGVNLIAICAFDGRREQNHLSVVSPAE